MKFKQNIAPPSSPLPIVLIGAGGIVHDAHLPAYELAGFPVAGVFDLEEKKARALKTKFPAVQKVHTTLSSLLQENEDKKVVYDLAVPPEKTIDILEKLPGSAPVLIQKPMGENLREARRIRDLCRKKKLISAVNFQLRYAPFMLAAKDIIEQGLIGKVYDAELMVCVYTPWELWGFLKHVPRVEILYHSIHYFDLMRSFFGMPERIFASTVRHPHTPELAATRTTAILDYKKDLQARIITNHGHNFGPKYQQSYFKIEGTEGAVRIQIGLSLDYPRGRPSGLEYITRARKDRWKRVPLQGEWFPHAFAGSMGMLQRHACDASAPLPHSTEDAFETMKLIESAYISSERGGVSIKKDQ